MADLSTTPPSPAALHARLVLAQNGGTGLHDDVAYWFGPRLQLDETSGCWIFVGPYARRNVGWRDIPKIRSVATPVVWRYVSGYRFITEWWTGAPLPDGLTVDPCPHDPRCLHPGHLQLRPRRANSAPYSKQPRPPGAHQRAARHRRQQSYPRSHGQSATGRSRDGRALPFMCRNGHAYAEADPATDTPASYDLVAGYRRCRACHEAKLAKARSARQRAAPGWREELQAYRATLGK